MNSVAWNIYYTGGLTYLGVMGQNFSPFSGSLWETNGFSIMTWKNKKCLIRTFALFSLVYHFLFSHSFSPPNEMNSSPQCSMLKLLDSPVIYASFPQAVTLIKKSWESLTVNPNVNLSTPTSIRKMQVVTQKCCSPQQGALQDEKCRLERTNFFCQGNFWHQFSKWLSPPPSGREKTNIIEPNFYTC